MNETKKLNVSSDDEEDIERKQTSGPRFQCQDFFRNDQCQLCLKQFAKRKKISFTYRKQTNAHHSFSFYVLETSNVDKKRHLTNIHAITGMYPQAETAAQSTIPFPVTPSPRSSKTSSSSSSSSSISLFASLKSTGSENFMKQSSFNNKIALIFSCLNWPHHHSMKAHFTTFVNAVRKTKFQLPMRFALRSATFRLATEYR